MIIIEVEKHDAILHTVGFEGYLFLNTSSEYYQLTSQYYSSGSSFEPRSSKYLRAGGGI